jgi:hypothetical protein
MGKNIVKKDNRKWRNVQIRGVLGAAHFISALHLGLVSESVDLPFLFVEENSPHVL